LAADRGAHHDIQRDGCVAAAIFAFAGLLAMSAEAKPVSAESARIG
jgi:hypothetical protein